MSELTRSLNARKTRKTKSENGFVLVFFAISLLGLIAIAGFVVDIGNWYLVISRAQNAADSAALAGAVYLPEDPVTAKNEALASLASNHVDAASVIDISPDPARPFRLRVTVRSMATNTFIPLINGGMRTNSFVRTGVGMARTALRMGSPSNVLGREPPGFTAWSLYPGTSDGYYTGIASPIEASNDGDLWDSTRCGTGVDYCNSSLLNDEYIAGGLTYTVHIPRSTTGNLDIQLFDAPFVDTDSGCTGGNVGSATPGPGDPANLYQAGYSPYCTGDHFGFSGSPITTTFSLYTPQGSPGGSAPVPGCTTAFPGWSGDIPTLLSSPPPANAITAAAFRHWYSLCNMFIDGTTRKGGDYVMHVTTNSANGVNFFSIRADITSGGALSVAESQGINVFSSGHLVLDVTGGTNTDARFYLVKVPSSQQGQTIELDLWDIGDASGSTATLTVEPPTDATSGGIPMTSFNNCSMRGPGLGAAPYNLPACQVTGITLANYNGKMNKITVPIPSDYSCADTLSDGCWVRMNLKYTGGDVYDITSWTVKMDGAPVRLVQQ